MDRVKVGWPAAQNQQRRIARAPVGCLATAGRGFLLGEARVFETVEDMAERLDLRAGLHKLSDRQRAALALYVAGYTQAEIGAALEVTQQAVQQMLVRAARKLRANL